MTKIIGIGNALTDILVHLPDEKLLQTLHLAKGGMFHIDAVQMQRIHEAIAPLVPVRATGGSSANTIHALAVLGDAVAFVGSVADDEVGCFFLGHQQRRGIDARLHVCEGAVSGIATTLITPDGERTFATHLGCSTRIRIKDLRALLAEAGGEKAILHVEGYLVQDHDFVEAVMREGRAAGALVSYDLASWNIVEQDRAFVRHMVEEYVDLVFANEEEAAAFSQQRDPQQSLHELAGLAGRAVVKVGKAGAWGADYSSSAHAVAFAPGLQRKAVDTTAAGDFFAAGFLHCLNRGQSLQRCLEAGNRLASEVIQVLGTQLSDERIREAVEER